MNESDHPRSRTQTYLDKTTSQSGLESFEVEASQLYDDLRSGKVIVNRYEVLRDLGKGGFGQVVLARDNQLDRMVAIKVPNPARFKSRERFSSLIQEAKMAANLRHDGIVTVFDAGWEGTVPFIVLEYIQGRTLADLLGKESWSFDFAARLLVEIAHALQHAHDEGFIHRDLKPQNILLDNEERPRISDFGLAVHQRDLAKQADSVVGTPMYMAPEQATGENHRIDPRTDIWALGVIFYQLLCRERPFVADSATELVRKITLAEFVPPKQMVSDVPRELDRICTRCLCARMSQRYRRAGDLAADLELWLLSRDGDSGSDLGSGKYRRLPGLGSDRYERESVVHRGLRPYRSEDSRFFARLLPGPYDRNGLSVSSNFWIESLKQVDPESAIEVGIIYGPSGCGKSSFVRAGVIPWLGDHVTTVYLDATATDLESRLASALKGRQTAIAADVSLPEMVAEIREHFTGTESTDPTPKLVMVIDQFEQWLARDLASPDNQLVQALRHADGVHVQVLLVVRDDFWLAVTRLMNLLDISIVDGVNAMLIDTFDETHAKYVLSELGKSMECLPEDESQVTDSQHRFIDRAIRELSEEGPLYPVRIAVFAELVRKQPWTEATLDRLGGTRGVGVSYLDHSVGTKATAARQVHTEAARRVLSELLPVSGNIKRSSVRRDRLMHVSGYQDSVRDFETLMRLLDNELRLLTPVLDQDAMPLSESDQSNISDRQVAAYRLSHDFLVPSIRQWLARDLMAKRGGRQQLMLQEQALVWADRRSTRYLPTLAEYLSIRWYTHSNQWTDEQAEMMRVAGHRFSRRALAALAIGLLCVSLAGLVYRQQIRGARRAESKRLLSSLRDVSTDDVPEILDGIENVSDFAQTDALLAFNNEEYGVRDRMRYGLVCLNLDNAPVEELVAFIPDSELTAADLQLLCHHLRGHDQLATSSIGASLQDADLTPNERFRFAIALAQLSPSDPGLREMASTMVETLLQQSAREVPTFLDMLMPIRHELLDPLYRKFDEDLDLASATTVVSAINQYEPQAREQLPRLLAASKATQFRALMKQWEDRLPEVRQAVADYMATHPEFASPAESDAAALAHANLAIAALIAGDPEQTIRLSRDRHGNARFKLIEVLNPESVDLWQILRLTDEFTGDPDMLSLLVLALDQYVDETSSRQQREQLGKLLQRAQQSPDAETHVTANLMLNRWEFSPSTDGRVGEIQRIVESGNDQKWLVDQLGEEMVILNIPSIQDEPAYTIAMGVNEISVELVRQFEREIETKFRLRERASCPATTLDPANIAAFNNWYSQKLGIPEDQWCYESIEGSRRRAEEVPKPISQQLLGIRLPTKYEWLIAAGGNGPHWYENCSEDLRKRYAQLRNNSNASTYPVGQRLPNPNGLIDLYGNVADLTFDLDVLDPSSQGIHFCAMGGSILTRYQRYHGESSYLRVDTRVLDSFIGFRVVRRLPSQTE